MTTTELLVAVNMFNVTLPTFLVGSIFAVLFIIALIMTIVLAISK